MKYVLTLLALLLWMTPALTSDEVPRPFVGLSNGGQYCETEKQLLDFLTLKSLVETRELAPFKSYPPNCGVLAVGVPLFYEPLRWVEYPVAHILIGRVTDRTNVVLYVYMDVRMKPEA